MVPAGDLEEPDAPLDPGDYEVAAELAWLLLHLDKFLRGLLVSVADCRADHDGKVPELPVKAGDLAPVPGRVEVLVAEVTLE